MSSTSSAALTKRTASTALMPPPPAPKRIKRPAVVLDEDTYTSAVSHIIRRDFFPGLAETDAQREYLNALESKDKAWIRESGRKLTQVMTPVPRGQRRVAARTRFERIGGGAGERTPSVWGADTPGSVARTEGGEEEEDDDDEGLGKLHKQDLNMSLGAFQAKYTSEDQESFAQILDAANAAKFAKTAWLRSGNAHASKQRLAQQKVLAARAESASASTSTALTTTRDRETDSRPAAPATHKHTPFNTLMFPPDSIESWAPTRAQRAENASLAPPKQVLYNNTRLPAPLDMEEPVRPPSPTLSAVRDAVAGRPRLNPSEGGYTGNETPRVGGYAFVDAMGPEESSHDDDAPLDLLARYNLDTKSTGSSSFTLTESSAREKLHHKMVDRIGANRSNPHHPSSSVASSSTKRSGHALGIFPAHTPRFLSAPTPAVGDQTPRRRGGVLLTPAAQRLFEKVGGATPRRGGGAEERGGFSAGGAGEWTPRVTPRVRDRERERGRI